MELLYGVKALTVNGMSNMWNDVLTSTTKRKHLAKYSSAVRERYYKVGWDAERYVSVVEIRGEKFLQPTKERALVDYMLGIDIFNTQYLVEAMYDYAFWLTDGDLTELYKVAEVYGVTWEEIDYWLDEAIAYTEYSAEHQRKNSFEKRIVDEIQQRILAGEQPNVFPLLARFTECSFAQFQDCYAVAEERHIDKELLAPWFELAIDNRGDIIEKRLSNEETQC